MRIAFVDLVFSWPPHGGADVDLYNVIQGIQREGHDVHLFVSAYDKSWERGTFEAADMPFPATRLDFTLAGLRGPSMAARFRDAVDAWKPDAVFVCDGFFLKPPVIQALAHYPTVGRFYAYEAPCMRDVLLFKDGAPCPNNYMKTPNICRKCALKGMKDDLRRWRFLTLIHEFLAAGAFMPGYHARYLRAMSGLTAVIVYNPIMKGHFEGINDNTLVFPGGVDIADYAYHPPERKGAEERKIILMVGRVEDPMKGLATLHEAGALLAKTRSDFEIRATHTDPTLNSDWFKSIGWHDHAAVVRFYQEADICVTPSIWEEPFGLVAVEAMATGRPVCASRVGGLQNIVLHEETGFLFDAGDSAALARQLATLLEDADLRRRMGDAGRKRAEAEYDWRHVIRRHYTPLLESLCP